jgi:hypothetical protein
MLHGSTTKGGLNYLAVDEGSLFTLAPTTPTLPQGRAKDLRPRGGLNNLVVMR